MTANQPARPAGAQTPANHQPFVNPADAAQGPAAAEPQPVSSFSGHVNGGQTGVPPESWSLNEPNPGPNVGWRPAPDAYPAAAIAPQPQTAVVPTTDPDEAKWPIGVGIFAGILAGILAAVLALVVIHHQTEQVNYLGETFVFTRVTPWYTQVLWVLFIGLTIGLTMTALCSILDRRSRKRQLAASDAPATATVTTAVVEQPGNPNENGLAVFDDILAPHEQPIGYYVQGPAIDRKQGGPAYNGPTQPHPEYHRTTNH